jgi:adenosylmethionine-8-amino-7-oxononanoate aminotransferase
MTTHRKTSSSQLQTWDRRYIWHPFTQMQEWEQEPPLVIQSGKGAYVYDTDGKRYLDGVSSIWLTVHGHRHPDLDRALRRQAGRIAHSTLLGLTSPPAVLLARELVRVAPPGLTRVFYSDDGSTAMEVALKMALQYWAQRQPRITPKNLFLHFKLSYHGDTAGAMSVGGIDLFHERYNPLRVPTLAAEPPYCYRCPLSLSYPSCQLRCLDSVADLLKTRHGEIAALVIEPLVQAASGMITAPSGYLSKIRELCTRHEVLLIADEVATGFGRTGRLFACDHERVTPDLMALSKGLTGGYLPLAATLTTDEIYQAFLGRYDEFKTFFHGHSYTGNALGCAVALANLEIFRKERTLRTLQPKLRALRELLEPLRDWPHVGDIRQQGFMVGIELVQDRVTKTPYPLTDRLGHQVAQEARKRGLLLRPLGNVIVLMPPLSITLPELKRLVRVVSASIRTVTSGA